MLATWVKTLYRAIFVCSLFVFSVNGWKDQNMDSNGLFVFLPKENPNMEKAFFNWPVVLHFDVKAKYRLILESSSGMTFFHPSVNQLKATRVCIRSTNQSNRSISVRLLFLFYLRVFISRSYENRSNASSFVI